MFSSLKFYSKFITGVIEELNLTGSIRQKITSLSNSLVSFISLKDLDISRNNISSLEGLQFCQVNTILTVRWVLVFDNGLNAC